MIRIVALEDSLDNEGGLTLIITGHGSKKVCAGASALWHTMLLGYERMASEYPKEISFESIVKKKS